MVYHREGKIVQEGWATIALYTCEAVCLKGKYLTSDEYHRSVGYDIDVLHAGVLLLFSLDSASNDVQKFFITGAASHFISKGYFLGIKETNFNLPVCCQT